jgi:hypothetical protein
MVALIHFPKLMNLNELQMATGNLEVLDKVSKG